MLNNILTEMKMIQLQLYLAKRATKKQKSPRNLTEVESHINHSLNSLNHLLTQVDDFKKIAESEHSASNRTKATQ